MKTLQVTALILDYDDTIARSGKPVYFNHLASYGYDPGLLEQVYKEIRMTIGNSPRNLLTHLSQYVAVPDLEKKIAETERAYIRGSVPYLDCKRNIERWRARGVPVHILSYGELQFQPKKVRAAGMPCEGIHIVGAHGKKVEVVRQLLEKYGEPVAHINDKAKDHDVIAREIGSGGIHEVWIRRAVVDSPYDKEGEREYIEIASFDDIDFKLLK